MFFVKWYLFSFHSSFFVPDFSHNYCAAFAIVRNKWKLVGLWVELKLVLFLKEVVM